MQQLLGNVGFWGFVAAIVTYIISPLLTEKVRKIGEKNNDLLETTVKKIDEQSEKIDKIAEKQELQREATKNIIRYRLIKNLGYAIDKGYTTSQELQEMVNLYESYKSLGGNGVVDKIYGDFTKLRIDDKKEE